MRKPRYRLKSAAAQFLLGIAGLAPITLVCFHFGFGPWRTASCYVMLIALVSLLGSFSISFLLSIVAVAFLNYFFVPPLFELRVDDPEDIERMAVFLTTSLVVTVLTTKLRASEARFRTFANHATDAFFLLDDHSTVLDVNRQACESLGYSRKELIGKHRSDFDADLDDTAIQRLKQLTVARRPFTFESRHRRKDGTSFPVEIRVSQFEQGGRRFLCLVRDITERKQAEIETTRLYRDLAEREAKIRRLVEANIIGMFTWNLDGRIIEANDAFLQMVGYDRDDLVQGRMRWTEMTPPEWQIQWWRERNGVRGPFEKEYYRKDGSRVPVLIGEAPFEDDVNHGVAWVLDLTEGKRAQDELRASETRFRSFVDHATDGFFLFDEDQILLDVNRQACEGLGYSREEMIGMHPRDFDTGLDEASIVRLGERIKAGETVTFETLHRRKNGTVFQVEVRARQFQHGAQRFRLALTRDITERKRTEEELRESEAKLQKAQQVAHFGWWERDFTNNQVSLSDEVCRIFGLRPVDLPEWHARWLSLIHPEDRPRAAEAAAAALLPGGPRYDVEYRVLRPDGTERIVRSQGDVTWDEAGRPLRQFGVLQDMTELRRAEKELLASEDALRRSGVYLAEAQRLSHTGTIVFNVMAHLYWSEENYRIWGFDPLEGCPGHEAVQQRVHPDDRDRVREAVVEALRDEREYAVEFRIVLPDGTVKHLQSTGRPLPSANQTLVEMVATHIDVTERLRAREAREKLRRLESDLAHMNRVSIMGELAASLAHEILHPVATARNNARAGMRFLEQSPPNLGEVREALACIVRDADRAKDIVGRMREQIKKAPQKTDPFDLNEAIHEVILMVRSAIDKNAVSVHTRLMDGLNPVRGDRVQLQQVVLNLILNAVEAMSSIEDGARVLSISTRQVRTSDILVAVQDSGPGIDQEDIERVFAPFYTTKATGIGMGLSICRSIVAAHGGRLWAEANRPRGATFQFTLPPGADL